ncbi:replication initiation protein [Candidatus Magnetomonas plexicatena]|uniref:replication initiation protein n=1 Tax=Candidatus Magnetomonas plexicatena TaxID=2552947 RepID=UPI001103956E|nr:replication initiation protein [Nitrospirales bacterium LBB_01]
MCHSFIVNSHTFIVKYHKFIAKCHTFIAKCHTFIVKCHVLKFLWHYDTIKNEDNENEEINSKKIYKEVRLEKANHLVVKSNDLNEAHYRLTTSEQRIILMMVSMIQPGDDDFHIYRIKVSDFLELLGIKNQQMYSEIKKLTKGLIEKVLIIKKPKSELQLSWFSSAEYFDGEGYVELCFDPKLKPYLLGLKECFVRYNLRNVIKLKSSYAIRIYELLKQYERIGRRTFEVEELKQILGIKPDEYDVYNHFKSRVLSAAKRELEYITDISFEIKEIKTGRKVTAIEFIIVANKGKEAQQLDMNVVKMTVMDSVIASMGDDDKKMFEKMQSHYQLSREQAYDIMTEVLPERGREYVISVLSYCRKYHERKRNTGVECQLGAVTISAFKEGWHTQPSLFEKEKKLKTEQQQIDVREKRLKDEKEIEERLERFSRIDKLMSTLPEDKVIAGFLPYLQENAMYLYTTFYEPGMTIKKMQDSPMNICLRDYIEDFYMTPKEDNSST